MKTVNKKQLIRIVRDVMSGISEHTIGSFRKISRGLYKVETTIGNQYPYDAPKWARFRHDRNNMTLREAKEYIDA